MTVKGCWWMTVDGFYGLSVNEDSSQWLLMAVDVCDLGLMIINGCQWLWMMINNLRITPEELLMKGIAMYNLTPIYLLIRARMGQKQVRYGCWTFWVDDCQRLLMTVDGFYGLSVNEDNDCWWLLMTVNKHWFSSISVNDCQWLLITQRTLNEKESIIQFDSKIKLD